MAPVIYVLRALTMALCAVLLLRRHARAKQRLLLYSGLCFAAIAVSNSLTFVDLVVVPEIDLYVLRLGSAIIGMGLLLYALIWERG